MTEMKERWCHFGCTGLVRDSQVRDWLWLGKVLAPLVHPTWGKLLRNLIWKRFGKLSCQWFLKKKKILLDKEILLLSSKENLIALASIKTKQTFFYLISRIHLTYKIIIPTTRRKIFFDTFLKCFWNRNQIQSELKRLIFVFLILFVLFSFFIIQKHT